MLQPQQNADSTQTISQIGLAGLLKIASAPTFLKLRLCAGCSGLCTFTTARRPTARAGGSAGRSGGSGVVSGNPAVDRPLTNGRDQRHAAWVRQAAATHRRGCSGPTHRPWQAVCGRAHLREPTSHPLQACCARSAALGPCWRIPSVGQGRPSPPRFSPIGISTYPHFQPGAIIAGRKSVTTEYRQISLSSIR